MIYYLNQSSHEFTKCVTYHCSTLPRFLSPIKGNILFIHEVGHGHPYDPTVEESWWGSYQHDQGQVVRSYLQPIRHHLCQPGISCAAFLNEVNMLDPRLAAWLCPQRCFFVNYLRIANSSNQSGRSPRSRGVFMEHLSCPKKESWIFLIVTKCKFWKRNQSTHFRDASSDGYQSKVTCPKSYSPLVSEAGYRPITFCHSFY